MTGLEDRRGRGVKGGQFGFGRDTASVEVSAQREEMLSDAACSPEMVRSVVDNEAMDDIELLEVSGQLRADGKPSPQRMVGISWQPEFGADGELTGRPAFIGLWDADGIMYQSIDFDHDNTTLTVPVGPGVDPNFPKGGNRPVGDFDMGADMMERFGTRCGEGEAILPKLGEPTPRPDSWGQTRLLAQHFGTREAAAEVFVRDSFDEYLADAGVPDFDAYNAEQGDEHATDRFVRAAHNAIIDKLRKNPRALPGLSGLCGETTDIEWGMKQRWQAESQRRRRFTSSRFAPGNWSRVRP